MLSIPTSSMKKSQALRTNWAPFDTNYSTHLKEMCVLLITIVSDNALATSTRHNTTTARSRTNTNKNIEQWRNQSENTNSESANQWQNMSSTCERWMSSPSWRRSSANSGPTFLEPLNDIYSFIHYHTPIQHPPSFAIIIIYTYEGDYLCGLAIAQLGYPWPLLLRCALYPPFYTELPVSANQDDIRDAFRRLSKKYHPDRNPGSRERF